MWIIRGIVGKGQYLYAKVPDHPKATKKGYVLLHRVLKENELGRLLDDDEIVHHVNNDKKDNRAKNLVVMNGKEHNRLHSTTGRTLEEYKCPECNTVFTNEPRQTKYSKQNFCSRSCNGKYQRRKQLESVPIP